MESYLEKLIPDLVWLPHKSSTALSSSEVSGATPLGSKPTATHVVGHLSFQPLV